MTTWTQQKNDQRDIRKVSFHQILDVSEPIIAIRMKWLSMVWNQQYHWRFLKYTFSQQSGYNPLGIGPLLETLGREENSSREQEDVDVKMQDKHENQSGNYQTEREAGLGAARKDRQNGVCQEAASESKRTTRRFRTRCCAQGRTSLGINCSQTRSSRRLETRSRMKGRTTKLNKVEVDKKQQQNQSEESDQRSNEELDKWSSQKLDRLEFKKKQQETHNDRAGWRTERGAEQNGFQ